jgi:hypothetical protein
MQAVIAFISEGGGQTSGLLAIGVATELQRASITFINVGRDLDWPQFPLGPGCHHPSPDGYRMIAVDVARAVAPLLAATSSPPDSAH